MRKVFCILGALLFAVFLCSADLPDDPIVFPQDDFGHQDNPLYYSSGLYAEWWYFNGQLSGYSTTTHSRRTLGFFCSLHQHKVLPYYDLKLAHSAIADLDEQEYYFSSFDDYYQPLSVSIVSTDSLLVHYEDAYSQNKAMLRGLRIHRQAPDKTLMKLKTRMTAFTGQEMQLDLILQPLNDPVLVTGEQIDMPGEFDGRPNGETVYLTKTKLLVFGKVTIDDEVILVNSLHSDVWFDHQYGDFLKATTFGWEWFSLRLDTCSKPGYEVYGVAFGFVDRVTKEFQEGKATFILPDGEVVHLDITDPDNWQRFNSDPSNDGYEFPLKHVLRFPELALEVEIESSISGQSKDELYEGHCGVAAVLAGREVSGFAFKELVY